jgi:hypothetical protein
MKKNILLTICILMVLLMIAISSPALAQEEEQIRLSTSKVFGYSWQSEMQGTFSITARGPQNLERVVFFIDEELLGEARQEPFRLQFHTDAHPEGVHVFTAVGYTSDSRVLASNKLSRNFVPAGEGASAVLKILLPMLGVIFGAMGLSALISMIAIRSKKPVPPGTPRRYGPMGGTICPKCKRPAPLGFLSPNLPMGKLQMCPHCMKWSIVRRASPAELHAAELAELEREQKAGGKVAQAMTEEERLRKEIEASRFND